MKILDFRSDTVTQPSEAMRAAMVRAEVGDDVYGEDPTVNRLQERAARISGKAAALFVPSGTMANQLALLAQTRPGDVVLAGTGAHLLRFESGAPSALAGVQIQTLGAGGLFDGGQLRAALPPREHHYAQPALVAVENTHNQGGGRIFPLEQIREVATVAREAGLRLHLDGARIFNASVATGVPVAVWSQPFDTVSFCLSKGLGAPAGSLLCADRETIDRIHRYRKMLGGGMRQVGILAAAGLHALEHHIDGLAADHENARRFAEGVEKLGFVVDPAPETNMVMFYSDRAGALSAAFRERGLLINPIASGVLRAVTHRDVGASDVEEGLERVEESLGSLPG